MSPKLQIEGQTDQRCPHCAALVRADAAWCSLCYADLRPGAPSKDVPTPEAAAPSSTLPPAGTLPSAAPCSPLPPAGTLPSAGTTASADAAGPASAVAGWPCQRCGGLVALTESACTHCGAGFLEGGDDSDPVVRRLRGGLSNQAKAMIMVGGAALLLLVIFGLGYLVRAVF